MVFWDITSEQAFQFFRGDHTYEDSNGGLGLLQIALESDCYVVHSLTVAKVGKHECNAFQNLSQFFKLGSCEHFASFSRQGSFQVFSDLI
jgi:hypothetical protein